VDPVVQEQDGKDKFGAQPEGTSQERLSKALEVANNAFKEVSIGFKYSVDKKTNREVVTVINIKTGEAIRQFPPEEILNMLSRMYDMLGILIDKKF
jgi:flagellar protein FlaG